MTTFTQKDGTVRTSINGASFGTFTRLSDGKTVAVNASGPATFTAYADGNATYVTRGLLVAIEPDGIWQFAGRVEVNPATGAILSHTGRVTSICAMLA